MASSIMRAALLLLSLATLGAAEGPCDILAAAGNDCVAAHSTTRALFSTYAGPLYQVTRPNNSSLNVSVLAPGGFADITTHEHFCAAGDCVISTVFDQSPQGNHLRQRISDGVVHKMVNASRHKIAVAGGVKVFGMWFDPGHGYHVDDTTGIVKDNDPESLYAVMSGKHYNGACCFDYGNSENTRLQPVATGDYACGAMEAIYFGNAHWQGNTGAGPTGPWVGADLEAGMFFGGGNFTKINPTNKPLTTDFVSLHLKGRTDGFALKGGDATQGTFQTMYDGPRPDHRSAPNNCHWHGVNGSYQPMRKQGAIILGTGGDNSNGAVGNFYEGYIATGVTSDATDAAIKKNIIAVGYAMLPEFSVPGMSPLGSFMSSGGGGDQCGSGDQAPVCTDSEDCCMDSPGCTGDCSECCIRQNSFCVEPRGAYQVSTCCPRWTVGCTAGTVGCCDPAFSWQLRGAADESDMTTMSARRPLLGWASQALVTGKDLLTLTATDDATAPHAESVAYALFPHGSTLKAMTIDLTSGNTTFKLVTGPAADYIARFFGAATRLFPFDSAGARFVFVDVDLTKPDGDNTTLTVYTIDPTSGTSTATHVTGCSTGGYPFGMAWDEPRSELLVGTQTQTLASFCAVNPETGKGTPRGTVSRGASGSSAGHWAAYISHVHDGAAYRLGYQNVVTADGPGIGVTTFQDDDVGGGGASSTWHSLAASHQPSTVHRHPDPSKPSGTFISLSPSSDNSFDVVEWHQDAATAPSVIGSLVNAHQPSAPGTAGPLGYIADAVSASGKATGLHASLTVATHPSGPVPGVLDRWSLATVDLATGSVQQHPLAPQPNVLGAEAVSLSGFGVV